MQSGQEVVYLHLDDIIPNRFQPREVFDERALKELAASIREHGVIQPIIVRRVNNKYEIIAGERRYKASALAGLTKIPAIINDLDDKEAAKVALLENLQRRNLNPIEEARTYQKILELDQMTQESLAKTMGKSQSAVANKLRLLALPDEIQLALLKENISERHARTLLNLKSSEDQKSMLKRIIDEKMSVRSLEEEIKKLNSNSQKQSEGDIMQDSQNSLPLYNNPPSAITNNVAAVPTTTPNFNFPSNDNFQLNESKKPNLMEIPNPNESENIVNYGEIDNDEIDNDEPDYQNDISTANSQIDLNKMKSSAMDLDDILIKNNHSQSPEQDKKEKISSDLDSLLNIKPPVNNGPSSFNPAREALKESDKPANDGDYFQSPELMNIELPNSSVNSNAVVKNFANTSNNVNDNIIDFNNNAKPDSNQSHNKLTDLESTIFQNKKQEPPVSSKKDKSLGMALIEETYNISPKEKTKQYNINQVVQKIRDTITQLQKYGAQIDTDEIDFENQYQIVIRIDKNSIN